MVTLQAGKYRGKEVRMLIGPMHVAKMRRKKVYTPNKSDVVIVGGGPSGLTLAACLGAAGFSVVCLERKAPRSAKELARNDGRTTALSYASMQILGACGLRPKLEKQACPILAIRVADQNSPLYLDFHHQDVGDKPFGWIIENHLFHRALYEKVRALKSVRLAAAAQVKSFERNGHQARIVLENGQKYAADLVIGADGRHSLTRDEAGIPLYGWDYDQTAIVCTLSHAKPHNNVAVEHFLPGGPLATLPMTGQRSSIVWTEKKETADTLMQMSEKNFTSELQDKVQGWLGTVKLTGPRFAYPLSLTHAAKYTAPRFALIGDAAHGIHPVAGQGFNLGMGDIGALLSELTRAASLGLDLGDPSVLRAYEKKRKFANGNMVLLTDMLDRIFSNANPPLAAVRRLGLGAVQALPPLKRFFMREAMGLNGRQNRAI